ncbi:hypothetical protein [Stenotrophomonas sp. JAI102]|uniref:hypothetical protein n=1 Tax=Stenotrophomonas sp. JAI102 TaxID=2723077 RepID=UPI0015CC7A7B|nr:hypothetical protein [Stenotrophomonas sp. JAI102]NYF36568.1 hypothetical protein [Stenotrophomonas sp. JAI102]
MKIIQAGIFLFCTVSMSSSYAEGIAFCVLPGERIERMWGNCPQIRPITEYTEAGEVQAFVVSTGGYTATVVPDAGIVDVVRFNQEPLPIPGISIGDSFSKVRSIRKKMELVFGWEEGGHLALHDRKSEVFIVFDLYGIPDTWELETGDESALAKARVIAVYWGERR